MKPTAIEYAMLLCCIAVAVVSAVALLNETPPPPQVRLAHQPLDAPFSRSECRNHQYIVIETDAHGVEREVDEGQFCDINE